MFKVQLNGRNLIGRILATSWINNYSSQFSKAEALETKRNILLELANQKLKEKKEQEYDFSQLDFESFASKDRVPDGVYDYFLKESME